MAEAILGPMPVTQQFAASAAGGVVTFTGAARVQPAISPNGAVNAASFQAGQGVAPGSYISLFGTGLSDDTRTASSTSLPLSIDGVSVSFDVPSANLSLPGRLSAVSPGQINLQVPWELQRQTSALIKVSIGNSYGAVYTLPLSDYSPAVFEYTESSTGIKLGAALDQNYGLIGSANPAQRGQAIQIFANGLGPVTNQPATGEPAPASPLANTTATPTVTIGGQPATVLFSGLAPGFAALYQVNVVVPSGLTPGVQPLAISIGGVDSKTVNLVVR